MLVSDRRTLIVLASLVGAMTVASGLLLMLEPGPVAAVQAISLSSVDRAHRFSDDPILDVGLLPGSGRWSAVVVQCGPNTTGVASLAGLRSDQDPSGYHFVIPARYAAAGRVRAQATPRWRHQQAGAYWAGADSAWVNHHAIGVCLEDDGAGRGPSQDQWRQLVGLVQKLQARFQIPADRVMLQTTDVRRGASGAVMPVTWFRQQLLTFSEP